MSIWGGGGQGGRGITQKTHRHHSYCFCRPIVGRTAPPLFILLPDDAGRDLCADIRQYFSMASSMLCVRITLKWRPKVPPRQKTMSSHSTPHPNDSTLWYVPKQLFNSVFFFLSFLSFFSLFLFHDVMSGPSFLHLSRLPCVELVVEWKPQIFFLIFFLFPFTQKRVSFSFQG